MKSNMKSKTSVNKVRYILSAIGILAAVGIFAAPLLSAPLLAMAQQRVINIDASSLLPKVNIFFTPQTATFIEGSTFEVPVYVNTKGSSINTIEMYLSFDPSRLSIIEPSAGKSIIGLWLEAPSYDNTKGRVKIVGSIANGITTSSGLILSMKFKAINTGKTEIRVLDTSRILSNDGVGTPVAFDANRATYSIVPKPPEGVTVFSDTHPFEDQWYNNTNPVLSWDQDPGVTGFSYAFDNTPTTAPDNELEASSTTFSATDVKDGIWYFHIKAQKQGVWGGTTHRIVRIDSTPPAEFKPTVNYLSAAAINRLLVSFFTTDSLSGLDHYEVGVIDKREDSTASPVFVQAESPFQIPFTVTDKQRVIVRAFDRAGNVRDASLDVEAPNSIVDFLIRNIFWFLLGILVFVIILFILHYYFGHHVARHARRAMEIMSREDVRDRRDERVKRRK
ncbi:MAG: cohesin domain-containing protein [Patescibacteria group bacterium]